MHSPAPRQRWLAWALLLAAPMAAAQSPQCGLFKADEGSSTLRISSPNRGEQKHFGSAPSPVAFQQIDGKLQLVNLEYGLPSPLQVRDRGRTVEVDGTTYILLTPERCAAAATPAEGSCLANAVACLDNRHEATPAALEAGCREGVPGMCLQLADRWRDEAKPTVKADPVQQKAALDAALSGIKLPAACDNGGFEQETPACAAALESDPAVQAQLVKAAMTAAMTEAMVTMTAPTVPVIIPAERRQQLLRLCREVAHGGFCERVAELSWDAGDPLLAVQALAAACTPGNDTATCERLPALQALGASLRPQPATALPCGNYRADGGLMDTLDFGDNGLVGVGWNSHLRARVEEGDIRIRHDRGGDFVLRPLPGGQLLGLDTWTRFQVFTPLAMARAAAVHRSSTPCCRYPRIARRRSLPAGGSLLRAGQAAGLQHTRQPPCAVRALAAGRRALHHGLPSRRPRGLREPGHGPGQRCRGGCTCTAGPAVQGRPQWPARGLRRARHPELGTDRSGPRAAEGGR